MSANVYHYYSEGDEGRLSLKKKEQDKDPEPNPVEATDHKLSKDDPKLERLLKINLVLLVGIFVIVLVGLTMILARQGNCASPQAQQEGPVLSRGFLAPAADTSNISRGVKPISNEWQLHNCAPSPPPSGDKDLLVVSADHGSWPASGVCTALNESLFLGGGVTSYTITASFRKAKEFAHGHVGIVYNFADHDNFDWSYVRTHTDSGECVSAQGGSLLWHGRYGTNGGGYMAGEWNTMQVEVDGTGFSEVRLNGRKVAECPAKNRRAARGGVVVCNGYGNVFYFKDVKIEAI